MPIYVGTSGFYYNEWIGPVYPEGTRTGKMLEIFSGMFDALEINSTYYRPPKQDMFRKYPIRTGGDIKIIVKLHSAFTHERNAENEDAGRFISAVKPIEDSGQFACFLAQFPQSFHYSDHSRGHIEKIRHLLPESPVVVEFRHKSWWRDDALEFLSDMDLSMCTVDLPDLPGLPPTDAVYTFEPAYVRLHGRNGSGWYEGRDERYTYKYKRDELEGILKKVKKLIEKSEDTFVLFNNHPLGNAPVNATEFVKILRDVIPDALPPPREDKENGSDQISLF